MSNPLFNGVMPDNKTQITGLTPVTSTIAPADIIQQAKIDEANDKARIENLLKRAQEVERERELLQKTVYKNANPSPIIVASIVIAIIFALYILYILFVKTCASGEWRDHMGNEWYISHNRFTNNFTVTINKKRAGSGYIRDNYVKFGDLVGVWDYQDKIIFMEGWHIERIK